MEQGEPAQTADQVPDRVTQGRGQKGDQEQPADLEPRARRGGRRGPCLQDSLAWGRDAEPLDPHCSEHCPVAIALEPGLHSVDAALDVDQQPVRQVPGLRDLCRTVGGGSLFGRRCGCRRRLGGLARRRDLSRVCRRCPRRCRKGQEGKPRPCRSQPMFDVLHSPIHRLSFAQDPPGDPPDVETRPDSSVEPCPRPDP